MAVSLWESPVIMGVAKRVHPKVDFFSKYFSRSPSEYHYSDLIVLDEEEESLLITPYAHPDAEAPTVRNVGYKSRVFEPACIKDKGKLTARDGLIRLAGEPVGNLKQAPDRLKKRYMQLIDNAMARYYLRLEVMASQIVKDAKLNVSPDPELKAADYEINFERHQDLTPVLTQKEFWSNPKAPAGEHLESWAAAILKHSGGQVDSVICGSSAYAWLTKNEIFKDLYKLNEGYTSNLLIDPKKPVEGVSYMGKFGRFDIYQHAAQYKDPADGKLKNIVAPNEVVLISNALKGNKHFAIIKDLESGVVPMDYFMKSWDKQEPSARFIKLESHPLLLLRGSQAVNGAMSVKVGAA